MKKAKVDDFSLCVSFSVSHFVSKSGKSLRSISFGRNFSVSTLSLVVSGRDVRISTLKEISEALEVNLIEIILFAQKIFDDKKEFEKLKKIYKKTKQAKLDLEQTNKNLSDSLSIV